MQPHHEEITQEYKSLYLPDGRCELIETDNLSNKVYTTLLKLSSSATSLTFQMNERTFLVSKITPLLHLEISAGVDSYNIGILKNVSKKLTEELRNKSLASA